MEIRIRITKPRIICLAVLIILISAGALAFTFFRHYPAHHFGVVKEGVLYRSGQPDSLGWWDILDDCGIRTIVSVRELEPDAAWCQLEDKVCRERGISLVRMPVAYVNDDDVARFMGIVNRPSARPVLIHCEAGSVRTGVIVAAYRMLEDGWSYARAVEEADEFGFRKERHLRYDIYLRDLEKRLAVQPGLREALRSGKPPPSTEAMPITLAE